MSQFDGDDVSERTLAHLQLLQDFGWLLLVVLTPLIVNLWGQQPFELPKVALSRTLVWLLAGAYVSERLLAGRSLWRSLKSNPLLGPLALLALVIAVTTATAVDWRLSLWGSYDRSQGAATLLTYLLLCLLAADRFRSLIRARQVVAAMVAGSLPIILLSLAQWLGWVDLGLVSNARSPLFANLGRSNFVGAYLAILTPLTLALLLTSGRQRQRRLWLALLVGQLVVIGLVQARSAWLATAVSLGLFALIWRGSEIAGRWRVLAWAGLGSLVLSGPLAVLLLGQRLPGSMAARRSIWQGALALIARRPLLGWGLDSLGMVFPRVYPPDLVYAQGRDLFVDRAHNLLLDWTVSAGIPGLLAFSLVTVVFIVAVARALRRPLPHQKRALLVGALAAVLGNVANNLVSFDVTPTAVATWLLIGLGGALAARPLTQGAGKSIRQSLWRWALVALLFLRIGVVVWQFNVRPLAADIAARVARLHTQDGQWIEAAASVERAVRYWPMEPAHHLLLSQAYWHLAQAGLGDTQLRLNQAETAMLDARHLRPGDPQLWLRSAQFYATARRLGSSSASLAEAAFQQALVLAPADATIYTAWGRFHLGNGEPETAAPLLRQAVRLDASNGDAYVYLGGAELALGRIEVALADYREAARLLPGSSQAYAGIAACYQRLGRPQEALHAAKDALARDPQNALAVSIVREIHGSS